MLEKFPYFYAEQNLTCGKIRKLASNNLIMTKSVAFCTEYIPNRRLQQKGLQPVSTSQGREMMKEVGACGYVEVSALKDYASVRTAMETAIRAVLNGPEALKKMNKKAGCVVM